MKKLLLILSFVYVGANAQINAYFSHCAFSTPDNKPYIETYLSVLGNSVLFKRNGKGKYQGSIDVGILFSQNGQIKASKKYNLMSPEGNDTLNRVNFIDQQRFSLDTGTYELEWMVSDKNRNGKTFSAKETIKIDFPLNKVNISDIEVLSSFAKAETPGILTKNGYDLVPYTSDFFPENVSELSFYAEIYNTHAVLGENEKYLLSYYIESHETKKQLSKFVAFKRETTSPVNILLSKFDISAVPSGNYNLVVEVKNKNNEVVAKKKFFFFRKNPKVQMDLADIASLSVENTFAGTITGRDTLKDFIRSVRPIATESEKGFIDTQLKLADAKLMQQFFYNFWQTRSQLAPEDAWNKYYEDVKVVNKQFGTLNYKGYETDRGRVYLQYGHPDKREQYPAEPNAYPYEIWVYYKLIDNSGLSPNQTNKQFIFYTKDPATNNYQILHSDALGETHDSRWDMKLHSRTIQSHDFEKKDSPEHFGGNSQEEFRNPK